MSCPRVCVCTDINISIYNMYSIIIFIYSFYVNASFHPDNDFKVDGALGQGQELPSKTLDMSARNMRS